MIFIINKFTKEKSIMIRFFKKLLGAKPVEPQAPYKVDAPVAEAPAPAPVLPAMEATTAGFNYEDVKPKVVVLEPVAEKPAKAKKAPAKKAPAAKKPRKPKTPKAS